MGTVSSTVSEVAQTTKAPRFRSVAYPSSSITHCVELVTKIQKIFGNLTFTARDRIAKELGISEGHIQTQLSSAVQYGLLELKSGEGYKPTPLFIRIYRPAPDERIKDALIEAFQQPELYKLLIEKFNGSDLPQEAGLATILFRNFKVSDQASTLAAKVFIENAMGAGVLNSEFFFGLAGEPKKNDEIPFEEIKITKQLPAQGTIVITTPDITSQPTEIKLPVLLDDGKIISIPLPNGLKRDDLEKIKKVIDAYL